jgi:hypothetical protein
VLFFFSVDFRTQKQQQVIFPRIPPLSLRGLNDKQANQKETAYTEKRYDGIVVSVDDGLSRPVAVVTGTAAITNKWVQWRWQRHHHHQQRVLRNFGTSQVFETIRNPPRLQTAVAAGKHRAKLVEVLSIAVFACGPPLPVVFIFVSDPCTTYSC